MRLCALVLLATVTTLAGSASAGAVGPKDLALRLTDLGPGYVVENEGCEPMRLYDDGPSHSLKQIGALHHSGCRIVFSRAWKASGTPPSPLGVSSGVFVFDSAYGPTTALTRPRSVVAFLPATPRRWTRPHPRSATRRPC